MKYWQNCEEKEFPCSEIENSFGENIIPLFEIENGFGENFDQSKTKTQIKKNFLP